MGEKKIVNLFMRAVTLYEMIGASQRAALAQCYVAALYFNAYQQHYLPPRAPSSALAGMDEKRLKMAEFYYRKALAYHSSLLDSAAPTACLDDLLPRIVTALAELFLTVFKASPTRALLEKTFVILLRTRPWFVFQVAHCARCSADRDASILKTYTNNVLNLVRETLQAYLRQLKPSSADHRSAKTAYMVALKSTEALPALDALPVPADKR
eukprot:NODE_1533_length_947_cov_190.023385_g1069_i0.p1 GENE.NODE_1533_length_947_cov_190.023385_g1069_i0~~NODE_1533_length_947_cov_190.023385_g1069_i0.p1  ORF type:complete len:219 (-),score=30.15 NODE_1533_length_947_cov_190.023385_g1069_i0:291-923(-)